MFEKFNQITSKIFDLLTSISNEQGYALIFLTLLFGVFLFLFSPKGFKDKNDKYFLADKDINKAVKEEHWKQRAISLAIFAGLASIIYSNASYFFALLSVFGAAAVFAIREELADVFAGLLMRSRFLQTAIYTGQSITVPDKFGDSVFVVGKIKTFKTILLNKKTSEYLSVRNVSMIRENIKHIVLDKLVTVKLFFVIDHRVDTKKLAYIVKNKVQVEFSNDKIYTQEMDIFKDYYAEVKTSFGAFPRVKNRCDISFKYITRTDVGMDVYFVFGSMSDSEKNEIELHLFNLINKEILKLQKALPCGSLTA